MRAPSGLAEAPALQARLRAGALAGEWALDPRASSVRLKSRVAGLIPVSGVFREVTGKGIVSRDGTVDGSLTIASASVDTKNSRRDTHLRSADFFDSDESPDITFAVSSIRPSERGAAVAGTLTVRGNARPLSFDAAARAHGDGEIWLDAEVRVDRGDFGITWNVLGMVPMIITIAVHGVFTKS
jgi:polyisoprenoid-binding protein YceI